VEARIMQAPAAPAPAEESERERADDHDDDSAEDAGYSQIGLMSEGEDSEEDDEAEEVDEAEVRERTGRSREEVETGDHCEGAEPSAEGSAAEAEGAASWVGFSHPRPAAERLPVLELRGSMQPRRGARPAEAGAEAVGDGWTDGAFDFDDAGWSAAAEASAALAAEKAAAEAATAAVEAAEFPSVAAAASQAETKDTPPLGQEAVDLIKRTMAEVQITPPPWVRRAHQLQRVQQLQAQVQRAAGGAPPEAEAAPAQRQWGEQAQHLASMLPAGAMAAALPLAPPMPAAPSSISGVCVTRRVTAKQLAAERREWRAQRKRDAAASKPSID